MHVLHLRNLLVKNYKVKLRIPRKYLTYPLKDMIFVQRRISKI